MWSLPVEADVLREGHIGTVSWFTSTFCRLCGCSCCTRRRHATSCVKQTDVYAISRKLCVRTYTHLQNYGERQPRILYSAFQPSGVGKWVPALAGKAKAGIVHSVSGWTRGVQIKLWDPWQRVPYLSTLEVCPRQGAIQIHVYLYLTLPYRLTAHMMRTGFSAVGNYRSLSASRCLKFTLNSTDFDTGSQAYEAIVSNTLPSKHQTCG